ncbi:hypothetical protein NLU13_7089 [Sarocladium strictum]|uniref:RGS domain-containing protein n=1 Tax=Sarocladium strictum TaxID=5046 RepID=A0AA39GG64_SARSR|nr:hypothetical protein NLU13_7089 [Sarocladium strictum]
MADANTPPPPPPPPPPPEAAPMPNLTIYNLPPSPARWDRIGIAFMAFCLAWTTLIVASMAFCLYHRNSTPALRVRCLPLTFTAVAFLHCYWILAWLVYPVGGTMPVVLAFDVQYFFMGIWFPLGIAVFHAGNLRFLRVAKRQRRWAVDGIDEKDVCNGRDSSLLCRLRSWGYTQRVMMFIGIGMIAQVLLTIGMWVACKKYHPTFGIPGTDIKGDTLPEQMIDLGRGWEWWPSVLWQFIWTWMVAPYLICKAWSIRDTMGWRTQTIGCCLANLHATPMFLVASYVPAFYPINAYFPPSQWIHLSIMMIEVFAVFIPLFQLLKHRHLARKTAHRNAKWDTSSQTSSSTSGSGSDLLASNPFLDQAPAPRTHRQLNHHHPPSSLSFAEKGSADEGTLTGHDDARQQDSLDVDNNNNDNDDDENRLLTMSALERVLADNPIPLQDFSALNDFSGENIAFLRRVRAWKLEWEDCAAGARSIQPAERLSLYNRAVDIYADFISPAEAEFPLNLSSQHHASLTPVFQPALASSSSSSSSCSSSDPGTPTGPSAAAATPFDFFPSSHSSSSMRDLYTGPVPASFDMSIFDASVGHVKYLVLTNTWPKFVAEMRARRRRRRSGETTRSSGAGTTKSGFSFVSRVSDALSSLLNR